MRRWCRVSSRRSRVSHKLTTRCATIVFVRTTTQNSKHARRPNSWPTPRPRQPRRCLQPEAVAESVAEPRCRRPNELKYSSKRDSRRSSWANEKWRSDCLPPRPVLFQRAALPCVLWPDAGGNESTRRAAETELLAAIKLDPENAEYRVMLAELYRDLGLKLRAKGEAERAVAADPNNRKARELLRSLKVATKRHKGHTRWSQLRQ